MTIRAFLGHGVDSEDHKYKLQTVFDNVSLLTPTLLAAVNQLVVERGHTVPRRKVDPRVAVNLQRLGVRLRRQAAKAAKAAKC